MFFLWGTKNSSLKKRFQHDVIGHRSCFARNRSKGAWEKNHPAADLWAVLAHSKIVNGHIMLPSWLCIQPIRYHTSWSEIQKYELTYVWLCRCIFPENFLCKTCLRVVRECRLIRRHVNRQPEVFHSTASVVNSSSRSVCELWAGPGLHMLSKHVESELYGWELQRLELSIDTHKQNSHAWAGSLKDKKKKNVQLFDSSAKSFY